MSNGRREGHSESVTPRQLVDDYYSDLEEDGEHEGVDGDNDRSGSSADEDNDAGSSQVQVLETSAAVENESTILQRQGQLRKQILAIHEDKEISMADKAKRIQVEAREKSLRGCFGNYASNFASLYLTLPSTSPR